ncbi:MAG: hypothetical protein RM049_03775 [Nostoc sp. DedQUE04]|nr:hypothetical protein [Nostoc sp. DedQUE04]MDZ8134404.1 hypothetical protein [Nostoc sp. DedQUE04]
MADNIEYPGYSSSRLGARFAFKANTDRFSLFIKLSCLTTSIIAAIDQL